MNEIEQAALYGVAIVTILGTLIVFIVQLVRGRDRD